MNNLSEALNSLKTGDVETRKNTARSIGVQGSAAAAAVPALIEALNDNEATVSMTAAWALGKIGHSATAAVPSLVRLAQSLAGRQDDTAIVMKRAFIFQALVDLDSKAAIPLLEQAIQEKQGECFDLLHRQAKKLLAVLNGTPSETPRRPFSTY